MIQKNARVVVKPFFNLSYTATSGLSISSGDGVSSQDTRRDEGWPSASQRFLTLLGLVGNLFRLGRHLMRASNYRLWRTRSFATWHAAAIA